MELSALECSEMDKGDHTWPKCCPRGAQPHCEHPGFFWGTAPSCKDPAGAGTWCTPWAHQLGGVEERGHDKKEVLGRGRTVTACPGAGCGQQGDAEDRNRAGSQGARPRDEFLESSNGVKAKKKKQGRAAPSSTRLHPERRDLPRAPCSSAKGLSSSTQRSSSGYYREIPPTPGDFWSSTQGAEPFPKKQAERPGSFLLGHHAAP